MDEKYWKNQALKSSEVCIRVTPEPLIVAHESIRVLLTSPLPEGTTHS